MRGMVSSVRVPAPRGEFSQLAMQELDLHSVKRQYIRAVYFWTRSITRTAAICRVDRNTVYDYLPEPRERRE